MLFIQFPTDRKVGCQSGVALINEFPKDKLSPKSIYMNVNLCENKCLWQMQLPGFGDAIFLDGEWIPNPKSAVKRAVIFETYRNTGSKVIKYYKRADIYIVSEKYQQPSKLQRWQEPLSVFRGKIPISESWIPPVTIKNAFQGFLQPPGMPWPRRDRLRKLICAHRLVFAFEYLQSHMLSFLQILKVE